MLQPGLRSGSHIVSGNRLRFEPGQSHAIRYDAAWLTSPALSLRVAPLLPSVAAMNRRLDLQPWFARLNLASGLISPQQSTTRVNRPPADSDFHRLRPA